MLQKGLASRLAFSDSVVLCNPCETIRRALHTCRTLRWLRIPSFPFHFV